MQEFEEINQEPPPLKEVKTEDIKLAPIKKDIVPMEEMVSLDIMAKLDEEI